MNPVLTFANPYRPGAGHAPPYLAGREAQFAEFTRLLEQQVILENAVLTGLRGVGKTVLLDALRPLAFERDWLWVGTDLSESVSVSESSLAQRLLADLSVVTSQVRVPASHAPVGFSGTPAPRDTQLSYDLLAQVYDSTPGLVADKIKAVLELAWSALRHTKSHGVIFAYDEAQNLSDNAAKEQFPLSVLLDVFQSIQKKGIPFLLVLVGLPTLFPKLVDARTFAERMFRVIVIGKLDEHDSRDAIVKPLEITRCPVSFKPDAVDTICREAGGYPYFIQFICREVFDTLLQGWEEGPSSLDVPLDAIQRKLDADFFAGRWARVTDRQREILWVIATLGCADGEFTIQDIVAHSKDLLDKPFSPSHANQMLAALAERGLVYKNRFGKYSFAVPLLDEFIRRTYSSRGSPLSEAGDR